MSRSQKQQDLLPQFNSDNLVDKGESQDLMMQH